MILISKPPKLLKGKVCLPASKSFSIRAFIVAACGGKSTIIHPSNCDDAKIALKTARIFGAKVSKIPGKNIFNVDSSKNKKIVQKIDVGESGTTLRFVLPLLSLNGKKCIITGQGSLKGRPNAFLTQTLRTMGVRIQGTGKEESVPIQIEGGEMQGGKISIDGSISSQFISALLIACPQLKEETILCLKGEKLVSLDYIKMTQQILKQAGVLIQQKDVRTFMIKGNQNFRGLKNFTVPSDYGLAAFLIAGASLIESDVMLTGYLNDKFIQADGRIFDFVKRMGVHYQKTAHSIKIKGPFALKGGDFSLKDCPDLVPIMSILALFAKGKTRLYDIKHARVKESDRISDLREELLKMGAKVKETPNELIIFPQKEYFPNCCLDPHNDHRLAMSFSILGLKVPVRVKDMECSGKSYPDFVRDFRNLGAKVLCQKG